MFKFNNPKPYSGLSLYTKYWKKLKKIESLDIKDQKEFLDNNLRCISNNPNGEHYIEVPITKIIPSYKQREDIVNIWTGNIEINWNETWDLKEEKEILYSKFKATPISSIYIEELQMRFEYNEKTHIYEPIHEIIWVDLLESNVVEIS